MSEARKILRPQCGREVSIMTSAGSLWFPRCRHGRLAASIRWSRRTGSQFCSSGTPAFLVEDATKRSTSANTSPRKRWSGPLFARPMFKRCSETAKTNR